MATGKKKEESCYLISYRDQRDGSIVTLKAKSIQDSTLGLGFVCISGFLFDTEGVVVNPIEEQLRARFENVKTLHLSIYSIVSVEEIGLKNRGLTFKQDRSNLVALPTNPAPKL